MRFRCDDGHMLGAIILVIALIFVIPVIVIISGGILAGIIGETLSRYGDTKHEGSELVGLNG